MAETICKDVQCWGPDGAIQGVGYICNTSRALLIEAPLEQGSASWHDEIVASDEDYEDAPDTTALQPSVDLRASGWLLIAGMVTGSPGFFVSAGINALVAFAKARESDPLRAEFSKFILGQLVWNDEVNEVLAEHEHALSQHSAVLQAHDDALKKFAELINHQQQLTGTEVTTVLSAVERVYERAFDPEKRELVGAALRSCLLNREHYRHGLRRRFLAALDKLEFGDVVALAALVHKDEELAKMAGFQYGRDSGNFTNLFSSSRAHVHFSSLEECELAVKSGGSTNPNGIIYTWCTTELAEPFVQFVEGNPDRLKTIIARGDRIGVGS